MVAYSFKARFREPILAGTKRQTIRAYRKRHAREGEELQLCTGMRTRHCALIAKSHCLFTVPIELNFKERTVRQGGACFSGFAALNVFAQADGFDGFFDMQKFWTDEHSGIEVFSGMLIHWGALV